MTWHVGGCRMLGLCGTISPASLTAAPFFPALPLLQRRREQARAWVATMSKKGAELRESETFRLADDGHTAVCMAFLDADGGRTTCSNSVMDSMFCGVVEANAEMIKRKTMPILLQISYVPPTTQKGP